MLSIKITPLFLFLLLLLILVISVVLGKQLISKEGFVSFQQSKKSVDFVLIPTYSTISTPMKLYDSLYFDVKNGNLIEVDSTRYTNKVDTTGVSIATTNVIPRINSQNSLVFKSKINGNSVVPQDTEISTIAKISPSYNSYIYPTQSLNTDNYEVVYIPWNDQTYVHVINKTGNSHVSSFYFNSNNKLGTFHHPANKMKITGYIPFNDSNNNSYVIEPLYDANKKLYQIGKYVKYDITNANLIIQTADGQSKTIKVYQRDGSTKTMSTTGNVQSNSVSNVIFTPFIVEDVLGQNNVLYLPMGTTTVVALVGYRDATKVGFTLNNVCRFTASTIDQGPNNPTKEEEQSPMKDSEMSEYFKWYWYWKSNSKSQFNYSDDYLLKTQIVPPVCPACPNCNSGSCTNCNSSGNVVSSGITIKQESDKNSIDNRPSLNYNPNSVSGVVTTGINDVGYVAGKTIGAAENVVTNVSDNVTELLKGAGSGVKDIAQDVTGLIRGAGSGVKDILTQKNSASINNNVYGSDNTTTTGPNGKPVTIKRTEGAFQSPYGTTTGTQSGDQYSYYGALPSKGDSNYLPVNADFSKFAR
jgi:hypothetical protein